MGDAAAFVPERKAALGPVRAARGLKTGRLRVSTCSRGESQQNPVSSFREADGAQNPVADSSCLLHKLGGP